jgi:hypothetical protein
MEKQELPKRKSAEPENEDKVENLPLFSPFHLSNHESSFTSLTQFLVLLLQRQKFKPFSGHQRKRKTEKYSSNKTAKTFK